MPDRGTIATYPGRDDDPGDGAVGPSAEGRGVAASADVLCQDLRRKLTGERPSDRYFRDVGKLADVILSGGFEAIAGVPRAEILMKYENK